MVIGILLGFFVGVLICLLIYYFRKQLKLKPEPEEQPDQKKDDIEKLRQNLRLKCMYDEEKIDRLIDFERQRFSKASEAELMQRAINRWERDNR